MLTGEFIAIKSIHLLDFNIFFVYFFLILEIFLEIFVDIFLERQEFNKIILCGCVCVCINCCLFSISVIFVKD